MIPVHYSYRVDPKTRIEMLRFKAHKHKDAVTPDGTREIELLEGFIKM
jgi:hypothetical protein